MVIKKTILRLELNLTENNELDRNMSIAKYIRNNKKMQKEVLCYLCTSKRILEKYLMGGTND